MALTEVAKAGVDQVQSGRDYLDTLANRYFVKPKGARGVGGFLFDYEGETSIQLTSDITDHYAEDNTAIQDHIAHHPIRISLRGFVGELVLNVPAGLLGALDTIQSRLGTVPAYLGKYTPTQLAKLQAVVTKTQNITNTVDEALARVKNVVGLFDNAGPGRTKQQKAYYKLQALWANKQLMIVDTPYGSFNNMVVESLAFVQDENTQSWSDICITVKQMRFVDVEISPVVYRNRASVGNAPQTDNGNTKGTQTDSSVLMQMFGPKS